MTVIGASSGSVSLCGPLPHGSLPLCFCDLRHRVVWNFISIVSVNVVRVNSYMNCPFYPACLEIGITINELYFAPERAVFGVVGVHETAEVCVLASQISLLLDSLLHRSTSFAIKTFPHSQGIL